LATFQGECIGVLHRREEGDPKLVLPPSGRTYSDQEIMRFVEFQEHPFEISIVRDKGG
jgi:hypothetical protein